jgi:methylglyoxal synthase
MFLAVEKIHSILKDLRILTGGHTEQLVLTLSGAKRRASLSGPLGSQSTTMTVEYPLECVVSLHLVVPRSAETCSEVPIIQ